MNNEPNTTNPTADPPHADNLRAGISVASAFEDHRDCGDDDPFFRYETRVPQGDEAIPPCLADPQSTSFLATARDLLVWLVGDYWGPATLALHHFVWQFRKFEILDYLRPIELLLRRMLVIEAFALAGSQSLPPSRPGGVIRTSRAPQEKPACDPTQPETWRVSFRIMPAKLAERHWRLPRKKLPPIDRDHFRGDPRTPMRFRRVQHQSMPLARRLEAVIRVINDPAPYVRRLAFRLRRGREAAPNLWLLAMPRRGPNKPPLARDANEAARTRLSEILPAYWSSG